MPLQSQDDVVQLCQDMARYDVGSRLLDYAPRGAATEDLAAAQQWLDALGVPSAPDKIL